MKPWYPLVPLLLLLIGPAGAESLRGTLKGDVSPDGPPVVLGLDDLAQIVLPSATKFTRGMEIEITIPRDAFPYRSSLAVFIYQNYVATKGTEGATGDRIGIEVLPPAGKIYLLAPLVAKAGLKATMDTAVLKLPKLDAGFPLAITILPIDKDLPPGYEKFQFSVKSRLVNSNLGGINLLTPALSDEERTRLKIVANGVAQPSVGPLTLEPGPYTLDLTLPGVASVSVTAVVAQGKTTDLTVDLAMEGPSIVIEAPEGTQVVLDGKRLVWKPSAAYPIDRGNHSVQFVIGNTVVSDTFVVEKGGRHRLSLKMDVVLTGD